VQELKEQIYLSNHLEEVFDMFYLQRKNINYIADMTGYSRDKVCEDLKLIREKVNKVL
jgi:division protein CdvB (Snf7/Vps24/ESCRT-III family)